MEKKKEKKKKPVTLPWVLRLVGAALAMLCFWGVPAVVFWQNPEIADSALAPDPGQKLPFLPDTKQTERRLQEAGRQNLELNSLRIELNRMLGQTLQQGIFITENGLFPNFQTPNYQIVGNNVNGMLEFVYRYYIPTYAALAPTACAVKQHDIPENARIFNQKNFIETVYQRISGVITSVDVYSSLFSVMDEYIYYRTHPEMTGLGGYYLYTSLWEKMELKKLRGLSEFMFEYADSEFYGDLYTSLNYRGVQPDSIVYYHLANLNRKYSVIRQEPDGRRTWNGDLYFPEKLKEEDKSQVFLGGTAPRIDIKVERGGEGSLLIFSDHLVKAYLPFLAHYYSEITIIDLELVSKSQLQRLKMEEYDQVLFTYSADTFSQVDFSEKLMFLASL